MRCGWQIRFDPDLDAICALYSASRGYSTSVTAIFMYIVTLIASGGSFIREKIGTV